MKDKNNSKKDACLSLEKRPKFQDLKTKSENKDKSQSIARSAQPGNVLLPRGVFYRTDLQPTERIVAGWLYDHMKPGTNIATGSQDTIALETGLANSTVRRALDALWEKHVIISVDKNPKLNGYYLSYGMRLFPSEVPRKRSRPHPPNKTVDNLDKPKTAKEEKPKLSAADPNCQYCYGSGWHRLPDRQGTKQCHCRIK